MGNVLKDLLAEDHRLFELRIELSICQGHPEVLSQC